MSLTTIRAAIKRDVLANVAGLAQVLDRAPEQPPQVTPVAWLGDASGPVVMGALETWTHTIPLSVVVGRRGYYEDETEVTEPLMLAILTEIRRHFTLGGATYGVSVTGYTQGAISYASEVFVGFTLTLVVKEKFATTLEG